MSDDTQTGPDQPPTSDAATAPAPATAGGVTSPITTARAWRVRYDRHVTAPNAADALELAKQAIRSSGVTGTVDVSLLCPTTGETTHETVEL